MSYDLIYYLYLFFVYSFLGYLFQEFYVWLGSFRVKNQITDNFLKHLPLTPIFGFGAVAIIATVNYLEISTINPVQIFLLSLVLGTLLELAVGKGLQYIFGENKFWDYKDFRFNYDGQICLVSALRFGVGGVFISYVLQPLFNRIAATFDLTPFVAIVFALFLIDFVYSVYKRLPDVKRFVKSRSNFF